MRFRRHLAVLVSLACFAGTYAEAALPIPVLGCGQVVPAGQTGVLGTNLTCPWVNGSIILEKGATLQLDGHSVGGAEYSVLCKGSCRVEGPGTISGSAVGVDGGAGLLRVSDVTFRTLNHGILGKERSAIVERSTFDAVNIGIAQVQTLRVSDSEFSPFFHSILAKRVVAESIVVTGGLTGIHAGSVTLINSSLDTTGDGEGETDLRTSRRPRLIGSTCAGQSISYGGETWGVCSLD